MFDGLRKSFRESGEKALIKQNQEILNRLFNGVLTMKIILPEYEVSSSHGMLTKGVATAAFGIVGLAMTMGSSSNLREIKSVVRIADKGVVIRNGTVDGSDLRIPWDQIVSVQRKYYAVYLTLSGNQQIEIRFYGTSILGNNAGYAKVFESYVNEHATGQVEEGWDVPLDDSYVDIEVDDSYLNITNEMIEKSCFSDGRPNFCMYCGHKVSEEDKNCLNCGHQLID